MIRIEILGVGCPRCDALAQATERVARQLKIDYELFRVTNILRFADYDVMTPPALVVDGQVKVSGRVPTDEQLQALLEGRQVSGMEEEKGDDEHQDDSAKRSAALRGRRSWFLGLGKDRE
jgi:small redox-active disulfide protein 2